MREQPKVTTHVIVNNMKNLDLGSWFGDFTLHFLRQMVSECQDMPGHSQVFVGELTESKTTNLHRFKHLRVENKDYVSLPKDD